MRTEKHRCRTSLTRCHSEPVRRLAWESVSPSPASLAEGARGGKALLESDQMSRKALPCKACVERSDYFRAARRHKNNDIISGCRRSLRLFRQPAMRGGKWSHWSARWLWIYRPLSSAHSLYLGIVPRIFRGSAPDCSSCALRVVFYLTLL